MKIKRPVSDLADFLRELPCQAFGTLTTPRSKPQAWWDTVIPEFLDAIQASEQMPLGWLRGDEKSYQLHSHIVFAAPRPLDCRKATLLWLHIVGTRDPNQAVILPYDPSRSAILYAAKLYGTDGDGVSLGGDLNALLGILPLRPMNARRRRRFIGRREQMALPSTNF